jgi:hypothetical protein
MQRLQTAARCISSFAAVADGRRAAANLARTVNRTGRATSAVDGRVFQAAKVSPNPASWDALQDELSRKTVKALAHASLCYPQLPAFMVDLANATTRPRKPAAGRPPTVSAADYSTASRCSPVPSPSLQQLGKDHGSKCPLLLSNEKLFWEATGQPRADCVAKVVLHR